MIKKAFLDKQVSKARSESKTPEFLCRLCFIVVEKVLTQHYSDSYSMRCLQSSVALSLLLKRFGIKSQLYTGELCVSQVFLDDRIVPNWNGFWGDDHHVWLRTEFNEIIDLTVKYLHLHPATNSNQLQMPAIWWSDISRWPSVIKYLPQGPVNLELPSQEMVDLEVFQTKVIQELEIFLESYSVNEVVFSPILHGPETMNELYKKGYPWLVKSALLQSCRIPHPERIVERERELMEWYVKKT
ncbi:hypothetical protein [Moritella sp. Urea-trap-13]|uniref:hypothetical protein n=1 Tax=Moritella sp. Urea-trap-13 TaxID=2058327 RepID=UPI000C334D74|nr:hypothetical protein [Moritella sp. Urea-trap-13]PKH04774.1 hypothetical protein CXF93_21410 [Moritella sp. Urea-trap-13]